VRYKRKAELKDKTLNKSTKKIRMSRKGLKGGGGKKKKKKKRGGGGDEDEDRRYFQKKELENLIKRQGLNGRLLESRQTQRIRLKGRRKLLRKKRLTQKRGGEGRKGNKE